MGIMNGDYEWGFLGWLVVEPAMFIKERFLKLENINANENLVPMFECKNLFNLPSGYVKVAIENHHRNSGISH